MDLKSFLQAVVPPDGYMVTADTSNGFKHMVHAPGDYAAVVVQCLKLGDRADVYFALASFKERGRGVRRQENALSVMAVWLDLDIGEGKGFVDGAAARAGIQEFFEKTKLPMCSIINHSGHGLHLYWALDKPEPLASGRWQAVTKALKKACTELGFPADAACTTDSARILRPPETQNHKGDPPVGVRVLYPEGKTCQTYSLDELQQVLKPYGAMVQAATGTLGPVPAALQTSADGMQDLGSGIRVPSVRFAKYMVPACPWLKRTEQEQGARADQTYWWAAMSLLSLCEDGANYARPLSQAHPTYTPDGLTQMWERVNATDESKRAFRCESIAADPTQAPECAACPHRHDPHVGSPLGLGRPPQEDELPMGWRLHNGDLQRSVADSTGVQWHNMFAGYKIKQLQLVYRGGDGSAIRIHHQNSTGQEVSSDIPVIALVNTESLRRVLMGHGLYPTGGEEYPAVRRGLDSWLGAIKTRRGGSTDLSGNKLGWSLDKTSFRTAQHRHVAGQPPVGSASVDPSWCTVEPGATLDGWKAAAQHVFDQNSGGHLVILASAFASPLVTLFPATETIPIVNVFTEETGVGKTTTMRLAQSVWMSPRYLLKTNDTENFQLKRLEALGSLPAYWDEGTATASPYDIRRFVMNVSMGAQRGRLSAESRPMHQGSWRLLMLACNNDPIADLLNDSRSATKAAEARVLDVPLNPARLSNSLGEIIAAGAYANSGAAGAVYAQHLVDHRDAIAKRLADQRERLIAALDAQQQDRVTMVSIATLLVGAAEANRCGVADFNLEILASTLLSTFRQRVQVEKETPPGPEQWLWDYINDTSADHITVDHVVSTPRKLRVYTPGAHAQTQRFVSQERGTDDGIIRVPRRDMNNWLKRNKLRPYGVFSTLEKLPYITRRMALVGLGTPLARGARELVLDIDTRHPVVIASGLFHAPDSSIEEPPPD